MKLEEIKQLRDEDVKVDRTRLDYESVRTPELHNKYLKIYTAESMALRKLHREASVMRKVLIEYYTGKMDQDRLKELNREQFPLKILRNEVDTYLDADKDYQTLKAAIDIQEEKVFFLQEVLKEINSRNWAIRNAIEFIKFTQGSGTS